uniref:Uncharacterized protein n=1 Tax=Cacopsylla melanoneura TaxID=428564 RepID=A0A8D9E823_9HEMI
MVGSLLPSLPPLLSLSLSFISLSLLSLSLSLSFSLFSLVPSSLFIPLLLLSLSFSLLSLSPLSPFSFSHRFPFVLRSQMQRNNEFQYFPPLSYYSLLFILAQIKK